MGLSPFLLVLEVPGLLVLLLGLELPHLLFGYPASLEFHRSLVCETLGQHVPLPDTLLVRCRLSPAQSQQRRATLRESWVTVLLNQPCLKARAQSQSSPVSYRELLSGERLRETLRHPTTCSHSCLDAIIRKSEPWEEEL